MDRRGPLQWAPGGHHIYYERRGDLLRHTPIDPHPPATHNQRYFMRFDYSHDRQPHVIPHVVDYEHGLNQQRNVPAYSFMPPPVVVNSATQNPLLFENFRRQSDAGLGFDHATFNDFLSQNINSNMSGFVQRQPSLADSPPNADYIPIHSQYYECLNALKSELAQTRAELKALKDGVAGKEGKSLPVPDDIPEENQEVEYNSADDGI